MLDSNVDVFGHEANPPLADLLVSFPKLERLDFQVPSNARAITSRIQGQRAATQPASSATGSVAPLALLRPPTEFPPGRLAMEHLRQLRLCCCSITGTVWLPAGSDTAGHSDAFADGDPLLALDLRCCPSLRSVTLAWP